MVDSEKYWAAIYYHSSDREKANHIIRNLGEDGVYLVRDGTKGDKVLVVFAENKTRKFRIEHGMEGYYLNSNHTVIYGTIEELMIHYYNEVLPGYSVYLVTPYQLHPNFTPEMLRT